MSTYQEELDQLDDEYEEALAHADESEIKAIDAQYNEFERLLREKYGIVSP